MIPTIKEINVETSGDFKSLSYGIKDPGMIFDILRNKMYSDPITSIVREISCNAIDAHREANKPNLPIKIHLPTAKEPFISFTDFGIGISPERMEDIFVNFGASTKRDSNDYIGAFGMGSKIPLSYSDSFTIITNFNGVKRHYCSYIDKTNIGKISLLAEEDTDEINGTTISIPVKEKDFWAFTDACARVFEFLEIQPQFNIGFDRPHTGNLINTIENMKIFDNKHYSTDFVFLIDFVPYRLDETKISKKILRPFLDAKKKFVFSVPNGLLSVSSSRETIHYNENTIQELENIFKNSIANIQKKMNDVLEKIPDAFEQAITIWYSGYRSFFEDIKSLEELLRDSCAQIATIHKKEERIFKRNNKNIFNLYETPENILKFPRIYFGNRPIPYSSKSFNAYLKEKFSGHDTFIVVSSNETSYSENFAKIPYSFFDSFDRFYSAKQRIKNRVLNENYKRIAFSRWNAKEGKFVRVAGEEFFTCTNPALIISHSKDHLNNVQNFLTMNDQMFSILNSGDIKKKIEIIKERCSEEGKTDYSIMEDFFDVSKYKWEFENAEYKKIIETSEYVNIIEDLPYVFRDHNLREIISWFKKLDNPCDFIQKFLLTLENFQAFLKKGEKNSAYFNDTYVNIAKSKSYSIIKILLRPEHKEVKEYEKEFSEQNKKIQKFLSTEEMKDFFKVFINTNRRGDVARMLNFHFSDRKFPLDIELKTV